MSPELTGCARGPWALPPTKETASPPLALFPFKWAISLNKRKFAQSLTYFLFLFYLSPLISCCLGCCLDSVIREAYILPPFKILLPSGPSPWSLEIFFGHFQTFGPHFICPCYFPFWNSFPRIWAMLGNWGWPCGEHKVFNPAAISPKYFLRA